MTNFNQLEPRDEHNLKLESNVRPTDWVNPKPSGKYNIVVIGAETAGLVTAAGAAGMDAKVALCLEQERRRLAKYGRQSTVTGTTLVSRRTQCAEK